MHSKPDNMKLTNAKVTRVLKIFHLLFATMWIGGVMALVSLQLGATPQTKEMMYMGALAHLVIDKFFLIPGGVGMVISALVYSILTNWGFAKHKWIIVKWILTIFLVIIGAGYMGVVIERNIDYSNLILTENYQPDQYWNNVYNVAIAGIVQLVAFLFIIIISVVKPWKKKNQQ